MSILDKSYFYDEEAAYAFIEARIWQQGRRCPHCGVVGRSGPLAGQTTRLGTYKCYACRKPFTVKIGTIFEGSHIPLHIWLQAIFLVSTAKEPFSANQLHRILGVSAKSAVYLLERIGEFGEAPGTTPQLEVAVEAEQRPAFIPESGDGARDAESAKATGKPARRRSRDTGAVPGRLEHERPDPATQVTAQAGLRAGLPEGVTGGMRWKYGASRIRLSHVWPGPGRIGQRVEIIRPAVAAIHFTYPLTQATAPVVFPDLPPPADLKSVPAQTSLPDFDPVAVDVRHRDETGIPALPPPSLYFAYPQIDPAAAAPDVGHELEETFRAILGASPPPRRTTPPPPVVEPIPATPRPKPAAIARPKSARGLLHSDAYLPGGIPIAPAPIEVSLGQPRDSGRFAYRVEPELLLLAATPRGRLPLPASALPEISAHGLREASTQKPLPHDIAVAMFSRKVSAASYQRQAADVLHLLGTPAIWQPGQLETPAVLPAAIIYFPYPPTLTRAGVAPTRPQAAREPAAPIPEVHVPAIAFPPLPPLPEFGQAQFVSRELPVKAGPVAAQLIWWIATEGFPVPVNGHGAGLHFPLPVSSPSSSVPEVASLHAPSAEPAEEAGFVPQQDLPQDDLAGMTADRFTESPSVPDSEAAVSEQPWRPAALDAAVADDISAAAQIAATSAANIDPVVVYPDAAAPPGIGDRALIPSGLTPGIPEHTAWRVSIAAVAELEALVLLYARTAIAADRFLRETLAPDAAPVRLDREYSTGTCDSDTALGLAVPAQRLAMTETPVGDDPAAIELPLLPPYGPEVATPEPVRVPVAVFAWQRQGMPLPGAAIDIAYHANDNRGRGLPGGPPSSRPRFWARARQRLALRFGAPPLHQPEVPPTEQHDRAVAIAARATSHEFGAIPAPSPFAAASAVLFRFAELSAAVGLMEAPVMRAAAAIVPALPRETNGVVLHFPDRLTEASEDWTASNPAAAWRTEGEFPAPSPDAVPGPGAALVPQPLMLEALDYRPSAAQGDEYALAPALHGGEILRREVPQRNAPAEEADEEEQELPAYLLLPLPFAAEDAQAASTTTLLPPNATDSAPHAEFAAPAPGPIGGHFPDSVNALVRMTALDAALTSAAFVVFAESACPAPQPIGNASAEAATEPMAPAAFETATALAVFPSQTVPPTELIEAAEGSAATAPLPAAGQYFSSESAPSLDAPVESPGPGDSEIASITPGAAASLANDNQAIPAPQPSDHGTMAFAAVLPGAPVEGIAADPAMAKLDSPAPVAIPLAGAEAGATLPVSELPEISPQVVIAGAEAATNLAEPLAGETAEPHRPAGLVRLAAAGEAIRRQREQRAKRARQAAIAGAAILLAIVAVATQQLLSRVQNGNTGQATRGRATQNGSRGQTNASTGPAAQTPATPVPGGNGAPATVQGTGGSVTTPSGVAGGPGTPPPGGGVPPSGGGAPPPQTPPPAVPAPPLERRSSDAPAAGTAPSTLPQGPVFTRPQPATSGPQIAQVPNPLQPPVQSPTILTPAPTPPPPIQIPPATQPTAPIAQPMAPEQQVVLRGIRLVDATNKILPAGFDTAGITIENIGILDSPAFRAELTSFIGMPVSQNLLQMFGTVISDWYREHDHPFVDVAFPAGQDITNGIVQVVVTESRAGTITARNNRYFSSGLLTGNVQLQPGQPIGLSQLEADKEWLNQNPFHNINIVAQPGQTPGQTDFVVDTLQEQFPLRAHLGYDNTGLPVLGRDHWTAGLDAGSEYFYDALLSYQYTSNLPLWRSLDGTPSSYEMHSGSIIAPLPWHDKLAFSGVYATALPDLGPDIGVTGITWQASGRYILSLPVTAVFNQQLQAGFDFKSSNNNILFGGLQVSNVTSQIDQFSADYSFTLRDAIGQTSADGMLVASPGGLSSGNTNDTFNQQQAFAQARYAYARLDATRLTGLPQNDEWVKNLGWLGGTSSLTHIVGQWASSVLLPTEQLGIGGLDTVPGYNERTANGSVGILLNEELLTPSFGILRHFLPVDPGDQAQLSGFLAYGSVRNQKWEAGTENDHDLMSAGFGVRYNLSHYLNFHFVYGWQLRGTSGVPVAEAPKGAQLSEFTLTISYP